MSVIVTGHRMLVPGTTHHATPVDGDTTGDAWEVSWLPGRTFTTSQATTAMVLASTLSRGPVTGRFALAASSWAAELGMTRDQAVTAIASASAIGDDAEDGAL